MAKWIKVLKSGKFTDRKGTPIEIDNARLDRIVAAYNPAHSETPLVIGHPKHDDPAFGWVEKFKRVGSELFALPKQLVAEFAEAVEAGRYKYVSCAIRGDDTIRHVGFLGAEPPAVKGLGEVALSEGDAFVEVELGEVEYWAERNLFRRLLGIVSKVRDFVIDKYDIETADKLVTTDELTWLQGDVDSVGKESQFSEPPSREESGMDPELKKALEKVTELSESVASLTTANAALTAQVAAIQGKADTAAAELAETEKTARTVAMGSFCDELIRGGRLTPAEKNAVVALSECLVGVTAEIELSEGTAEGAASSKLAPVEYLKGLLKRLGTQVELSEIATKGRVGTPVDKTNSTAIAKAAQDYQLSEEKAGRVITISQAVQHIVTGGDR